MERCACPNVGGRLRTSALGGINDLLKGGLDGQYFIIRCAATPTIICCNSNVTAATEQSTTAMDTDPVRALENLSCSLKAVETAHRAGGGNIVAVVWWC